MRLFIIVLVLLNLIYFFLPKDTPPAAPAAGAAHPGVPALVLLSEVQTPPPTGAAHAQVAERTAASAPPPQPATGTPAPKTAEQAAAPGEPLDQPALHCRTVGPFYSQKELQRAKEVMRPLAEHLTVRVKTRTRIKDYQVYLPPLPSQAAARKMVAKLRRAGVRDIYLYRRGELRNAVSLGVYTEKERAELRARQLRRRGYDVKVRPRTEEMSIYWVDVDSREQVDWTTLLRKRLRTGAGGVDDLPRDCAVSSHPETSPEAAGE